MMQGMRACLSAYSVVLTCLVCWGLLTAPATSANAGQDNGCGQLYLISTGVGDPDLATIRAVEAMQESDIIICRDDTRQKFSKYLEGKTFWEGAFEHWRTHGETCDTLDDPEKREKCRQDRIVRQKLEERIRSAVAQGKTVAVMGSGDMFIYGGPYRWYREEMADLNLESIPGVSCLNAANALIGKDLMGGSTVHAAVLTHYRGIDKLAKHQPTMVVFTMRTEFSDLVDKLREYYPDDTPIAVAFFAGDKEKEYTISGQLDSIEAKTADIDFPFEHLVYVGDFMKEPPRQ